MKYDSLEHIDNLKKKGVYPKIHNDIFKLHQLVPVDNVLDVGCCYGLLSHRLSQVYDNVVGIEANSRYAEHFIFKDNIRYYNFEINKKNIGLLDHIIKKHNIQAVYCRRVIPSIYDTGGLELVQMFKDTLIRNNIEYLITEGMFKFKHNKNYFKTCYEEFAFFGDEYEVIQQYNNCGVLKLKK